MPQTIEFTRPKTDSVASLAPRFDCTLRDGGVDAAWMRVTGELDLVTAPILARALSQAEENARRVVLDLRELTFLDSSGAHVIFDADYRATAAGRRLVLVRGPANVNRVLDLARPSDSLVIVDLDPGVPPVLALLMLAQRDRTDERLGWLAGVGKLVGEG